MGAVHLVVGGQYGSEGKGAFVGHLVKHLLRNSEIPYVVRTGGPNAGHTIIDAEGKEWKLRQIPVAAVVDNEIPLGIAPDSEIEEDVLHKEIYLLETMGYPVLGRLTIDKEATLINDGHKEREVGLVEGIGSTGKGVGAARADRIMRSAATFGGEGNVLASVRDWLATPRGQLIIEGTQGFGLGLHAGLYPKCTSRDVRGIDLLAGLGLSPWEDCVDRVYVWIVMRTYPIRVAGDSGPMLDETSWEALGLDPEKTTVTQRIRRVGAWDPGLARAAIAANGGSWSRAIKVVLMHFDYIAPAVLGDVDTMYWEDETLQKLEEYAMSMDHLIDGVGTGPRSFVWEP